MFRSIQPWIILSKSPQFVPSKRFIYKDIKGALESTVSEWRGTLLESLARRMNKKDAEMLKKYMARITDENKVENKTKPKPVNAEKINNTEIIAPIKQEKAVNPIPTTKAYDIPLLHPVFGQLILDLGYKTVYVTNLRRLVLCPVWKKQRILRVERAQSIIDFKQKANTLSKLPGVITLYHNIETGETGVVDGQHRAGALVILAQQGLWDDLARNIMIDVFPVTNKEEVVTLFKEINSAEPVRMIDLETISDAETSTPSSSSSNSSSSSSSSSNNPTEDTSATTTTTAATTLKKKDKSVAVIDTHTIITEAAEYFVTTYPDMFKPTSRCRIPHLNVDVFRDELYDSNILHKYNLRNTDALIKKLNEWNLVLKEKYNPPPITSTTTSKKNKKTVTVSAEISDTTSDSTTDVKSDTMIKAEAKAKLYDFYLGLGDKVWYK